MDRPPPTRLRDVSESYYSIRATASGNVLRTWNRGIEGKRRESSSFPGIVKDATWQWQVLRFRKTDASLEIVETLRVNTAVYL